MNVRCTWIRTEASEQGKTSERKQLQIGTGGRTIRLIDADAMNAELFYKQVGGKDSLITAESAFEMINAQPTAYDVDAVVKQLDEYITKIVGRKSALYQTVMQIVKGGGVNGN